VAGVEGQVAGGGGGVDGAWCNSGGVLVVIFADMRKRMTGRAEYCGGKIIGTNGKEAWRSQK
jgi:hypothetical protein